MGSVGASRTRKWLCCQRWKEETVSRLSVEVGVGAFSPLVTSAGRGEALEPASWTLPSGELPSTLIETALAEKRHF